MTRTYLQAFIIHQSAEYLLSCDSSDIKGANVFYAAE